MGEFNRLMARDGHEFDAWIAPTAEAPLGAVLIAQEIFGVNSHIRAVADRFAAAGFLTIAPCLFDRVRRGVELGYGSEQIQEGRGYALQVPIEKVLLDLAASLNVVKHAGRVGIVGYCWGGTLAYVAAAELPVTAAVAFYGTRIVEHLHRKPRAAVQYHFGRQDQSIPPEAIVRIRAADPSGEFHEYDADHGFNCDQRAMFNAEAARIAHERTLNFLTARLAGADHSPAQTEQDED